MVSINFIAPIVAVAGYASAQGFLLNQASRIAVEHFASARNEGVPEQRASSEAGHIASVLIHEKEFQNIANQAVQAFPNIDKPKIKQLVQSGDKAFTAFSNGPSYKPLIAYVKSVEKDFNTQKIISDVKSMASAGHSRYSDQVKDFFNDADGKAIGSTAYSLGLHVASDLGMDKTYLKEVPKPPRARVQMN